MMPNRSGRPTKQQLAAAHGRGVPDVIAPDLKVLFCGINPGLYSGAVRHHFARPGNRFWPALHLSGFTPRLLSPFEERELLRWDCGVTNFVNRATGSAAELSGDDLRRGARRLRQKVRRYRPRVLAVLGLGAFRATFDRPAAKVGRQEMMIGSTAVWVLPNPSGLNAHYQLDELVKLFRELKSEL